MLSNFIFKWIAIISSKAFLTVLLHLKRKLEHICIRVYQINFINARFKLNIRRIKNNSLKVILHLRAIR